MPFDVSDYNGALVVQSRPHWAFRIAGLVIAGGFWAVVVLKSWPDGSPLWHPMFALFMALITLAGVIAVFEPYRTLMVMPGERRVVLGRRWLWGLTSETWPFDEVGRVEVLFIDDIDSPTYTLRLHHAGGRFHVIADGGDGERRAIEKLADDLRRMIGLPVS